MGTYHVTGGAGFIGSHIVTTLCTRGHSVRVLDNLSTGRLLNLSHVLAQIEFIHGDTLDLDTLRTAMVGTDYALRQAALPSVSRSIRDPVSTHAANATRTLNGPVAALARRRCLRPTST